VQGLEHQVGSWWCSRKEKSVQLIKPTVRDAAEMSINGQQKCPLMDNRDRNERQLGTAHTRRSMYDDEEMVQ